MKQKLITLTTDFGDQFAVSQLHAVLARLGYAGKLIENHSVTPFSIVEGSFELAVTAKFSPPGAIHVGVVDPGVGSHRRGIVIETRKSFFVGPDNGLLCPAATRETITKAWYLLETTFSDNVSHTFHGRDVFIKTAFHLTNLQRPEKFGCKEVPVDSLTPLAWQKRQVLHIDHYGNIKVHWPQIHESIRSFTITTKSAVYTVPFVNTFSDVPAGQALALLGSSDTLELAMNRARADAFFRVRVGEVLHIRSS